MYTHAEHLQKNTEVKTRKDCLLPYQGPGNYYEELPDCGLCTGALEANFNSKGRHPEYDRSVEDLTGVFSIEKFIQLWSNDACGDVQVDWLPCI